MNNKVNIENDILGRYLNREKIEKAPDGFSEKVMTLIRVEQSPVKIRSKFRTSLMVPLITAVITGGLILVSVLYSSPSESSVFAGIAEFFNDISISLPVIKLDKFQPFSLPSVVIYISIGFLGLSVFDRVLHRVFHKNGR